MVTVPVRCKECATFPWSGKGVPPYVTGMHDIIKSKDHMISWSNVTPNLMIFIMQFPKRNFNFEKMRLPKGECPLKKWNRKGNLQYFPKKQHVVCFGETQQYTFWNFFKRQLLGRGKKLGDNFGSDETWEAKKRPGAIFDHRKPIGSRGIGNRGKITYLNSKLRIYSTFNK